MTDDAAGRVDGDGEAVGPDGRVRGGRGERGGRQRERPGDGAKHERAPRERGRAGGHNREWYTLRPMTSETPAPRHLAAVALTSATLLMTELALTRIFSVIMYYHFAFLAISIALFGISASGVLAYVARRRLARIGTDRLL